MNIAHRKIQGRVARSRDNQLLQDRLSLLILLLMNQLPSVGERRRTARGIDFARIRVD